MAETEQYPITDIAGDCLTVERANGSKWLYKWAIKHREVSQAAADLMAERKLLGWPELAIGTFERKGKYLNLKEVGL